MFRATRPTDNQLKITVSTNCCGVPPDDGLKICPKHVEVDGQNKLRINSASSWFHYTGVLLTNGVMQWRLITKGIHA